ncbi:MAG: VPS10 domain-containing protein [Actinomycetota bacterium]
MRIFLGGSKGLVLYEDEELTPLHSEPLLSAIRPYSGRLVAGTAAGAILTFDSNGEARFTAKDLGRGVQCLASRGGNLYAGIEPAGIWTSADQGDTWEEVSTFDGVAGKDAWSAPWGTPMVSCLAAHQKDPNLLFCGVEVGGLYRSRDNGKSWAELYSPHNDVHSLEICPARNERLYITTGLGGFCSDDEGHAWRPMGTANRNQFAMGLAAHPTEADRVIISASAGPPPTWGGDEGARCDIYLSTDAGRRFRSVVRGMVGGVRRNALVINSKVPSEIVFGTSTGQLHYSNDGGESFDEMAAGLGVLRTLVFA